MTAEVLKFKRKSKTIKTPWGHEFKTESEYKAFIMGMQQVIGSNGLQNLAMMERLAFCEVVED